MIQYLNNIFTLVLWLDFLQRYFPNQSLKIKQNTLNNLILMYSYLEINYNIYLSNEKSTEYTFSENLEELENNCCNEEIINIFNKYKNQEKEK